MFTFTSVVLKDGTLSSFYVEQILCDFFIERSQKVSASDTDRSYPFAKQLKEKNTTGRFTYGKIFLEAILPEENKIYKQSNLRWVRVSKLA